MFPNKINDDFEIRQKLGNGACGDVFKADMKGGGKVAIKFEAIDADTKTLSNEIKIYEKMQATPGFPKIFDSGTCDGFHYLAMELLGPSLEKLLSERGRFGLPTVSKIGIALLNRIEALHKQNVVHGDIKPPNICLGLNNPSELYLIDLGFSKVIVPNKTCTSKYIRGTLKFMSVGAHEGYVSFQTDIESIAFMLAFLANGELPWDLSHVKHLVNQGRRVLYNKVHEIKKASIDGLICNLPKPIGSFLAASQFITHSQRPDYDAMRDILK